MLCSVPCEEAAEGAVEGATEMLCSIPCEEAAEGAVEGATEGAAEESVISGPVGR